MFNKLSNDPELFESSLTEMQKLLTASGEIAEKVYELQSRAGSLCYRFFGSFPVPAFTDDSRKEGDGYLYELDTNLRKAFTQLAQLEAFLERLEKL